jgi:hypothetical protein
VVAETEVEPAVAAAAAEEADVAVVVAAAAAAGRRARQRTVHFSQIATSRPNNQNRRPFVRFKRSDDGFSRAIKRQTRTSPVAHTRKAARGDETIEMRLGLLRKPDDLEFAAMTTADGTSPSLVIHKAPLGGADF